jgi:hypothetical protein
VLKYSRDVSNFVFDIRNIAQPLVKNIFLQLVVCGI